MRPAKTSLVVFISSQISTVVGFVATFYIARYLGAATLGMYAIITAMLFWLHVPASSVDSALTKRISEGTGQGSYLSAGLVMTGTSSILIAIGVILFAMEVNAYVGYPISQEIAVLVLCWFLAKTIIAGLQGQQRVAVSSFVWTFGRVIRTGSQIGLTLLLTLGLAGLVWGHILSFIAIAIFGAVFYEIRPKLPRRSDFRSLFEYARYSWLGRISGQAFNWLDTVILAVFVSSTLIGIYEVAWTIASTLGIVSTAITQTLFPNMSGLDAREEDGKIKELLEEGLIFAGFFAIPGLFGAAIIGSEVLGVFGTEFSKGSLVLIILVLARLAHSFSSQFKNTVNAVDRPDLGFKINSVFLSSNLVLNVLLIPTIGWVGAALATAISSVLTLVVSLHYTNQLLPGVSMPRTEVAKEVIASSVMVGPVFLLSRLLPSGRLFTVGTVFIGAIIYVVVIVSISSNIRLKLVSLLPTSASGRIV